MADGTLALRSFVDDSSFIATLTDTDGGITNLRWAWEGAVDDDGATTLFDASATDNRQHTSTATWAINTPRFLSAVWLHVTVTYTDSAGDDNTAEVTFGKEPVLDTTAPTLESIETDKAGAAVTFTFNEPLDEDSVPAPAAFTVLADGTQHNAENVAITARKVGLSLPLNGRLASGATITAAYTQPATNPLQDAAGNKVASFAATAVTNNVTATSTTEPTKPTGFSVVAAGQAFRLRATTTNGGAAVTKWQYKIAATSGGLASASWTDIPSSAANSLDWTTANIGYSTTRHFQVRAVNSVGNSAASDVDDATTGAADTTPPALVSIVTNDAGTLLTFTFDEDLNDSFVPALSAFHMLFGGTRKSGASLVVDEREVRITFRFPFAAGIAITAAYTQPATNPLQDAAGNEVASFAATAVTNNVTTEPTKPTGFSAVADGQAFRLRATTTDGGAAVTKWQYKIAATSGGLASASWTDIPSSAANSLDWTTANIGYSTTRHFQVRAVNSVGNSAASDVDDATTGAAPVVNTEPTKPTGFSAVADGQAFRLRATTTDGGAAVTKWQYKIAATSGGLASASWTDIPSSAANSLDWTTANIGYSTTRHFQVRAVNSVGNSAASDVDDATTGAAPVVNTEPTKPTGFSAVADGQAFRLRATTTDGGAAVTKWQYKIAATSGGLASASWTDIPSSAANSLDWTTANIGYSTTRHFQVRAVNSVGNSAASDVDDATTGAAPVVNTEPTKPTGFSVTTIDQAFRLQAGVMDGGAAVTKWQYKIAAAAADLAAAAWTDIPSSNANTLNWTTGNIGYSTQRYFQVRAVNSVGNGPASDVKNATTDDASVVDADEIQVRIRHVDRSGNESAWSAAKNVEILPVEQGAEGHSIYEFDVYFQATPPRSGGSAPARPVATSYDSRTDALTGLSTGWTRVWPGTDNRKIIYAATVAVTFTAQDPIDDTIQFSIPVVVQRPGDLDIVYRRSRTKPSRPSNTALTTVATGWTQGNPTGTDALWQSVRKIVSIGDNAYWVYGEPTPVEGRDGQSLYEFDVYRAVAPPVSGGSAPAKPTATRYESATNKLVGLTAGWSRTKPERNVLQMVYASTATTLFTASLPNDETVNFSDPIIVERPGDVDVVFQRAASRPSKPANTALNTVATGWSTDVSAGTDPVWQSVRHIVSADHNAYWTYTTPQGNAEIEGVMGADGFGVYELTVFTQRKLPASGGTAPARPTATRYESDTDTIVGLTATWSRTRPADNPRQAIYAATVVAVFTASAPDDTTLVFSNPVIVDRPGDLDIVYQRSATKPAKPANTALDTIAAGWTQGNPPGQDTLWQSVRHVVSTGNNAHWQYSEPTQVDPDKPTNADDVVYALSRNDAASLPAASRPNNNWKYRQGGTVAAGTQNELTWHTTRQSISAQFPFLLAAYRPTDKGALVAGVTDVTANWSLPVTIEHWGRDATIDTVEVGQAYSKEFLEGMGNALELNTTFKKVAEWRVNSPGAGRLAHVVARGKVATLDNRVREIVGTVHINGKHTTHFKDTRAENMYYDDFEGSNSDAIPSGVLTAAFYAKVNNSGRARIWDVSLVGLVMKRGEAVGQSFPDTTPVTPLAITLSSQAPFARDVISVAIKGGAPPYTIRWIKDGTTIAGETDVSYAVRDSDVGSRIDVEVIDSSSTRRRVNGTRAVRPPGADSPLVVTIQQTAPIRGVSLSCRATGGTAPYTGQWFRINPDGSNPVRIAGATGLIYTPGSADVGKGLRCVVTDSTSPAMIESAQILLATIDTFTVEVDKNNPRVNEAIKCIATGGSGEYTYQWIRHPDRRPIRNQVEIPGATSEEYTPVVADIGSTLSCRVTSGNAVKYAQPRTSVRSATYTKLEARLNDTTPTVGQTLRCIPTGGEGDGTYTFTWWKYLGGAFASPSTFGGASATQLLSDSEKGFFIWCTVFSGGGKVSTGQVSRVAPRAGDTDLFASLSTEYPVEGQEISVYASGGQAPYTYEWFSGATPIPNSNTPTIRPRQADALKILSCDVTDRNNNVVTVVAQNAVQDTHIGGALSVVLNDATPIEGEVTFANVQGGETGEWEVAWQAADSTGSWEDVDRYTYDARNEAPPITLVSPELLEGNKYRVCVTDANETVYSNETHIIPNTPLTASLSIDGLTYPAQVLPIQPFVGMTAVVSFIGSSGTPVYQWRHNGVDIPGANTNRLYLRETFVDGIVSVRVTRGGETVEAAFEHHLLVPPAIEAEWPMGTTIHPSFFVGLALRGGTGVYTYSLNVGGFDQDDEPYKAADAGRDQDGLAVNMTVSSGELTARVPVITLDSGVIATINTNNPPGGGFRAVLSAGTGAAAPLYNISASTYYASVAGAPGTIDYQWQKRHPIEGTWENIAGQTARNISTNLSVASIREITGHYIRCCVRSGGQIRYTPSSLYPIATSGEAIWFSSQTPVVGVPLKLYRFANASSGLIVSASTNVARNNGWLTNTAREQIRGSQGTPIITPFSATSKPDGAPSIYTPREEDIGKFIIFRRTTIIATKERVRAA